MSLSCFFTQFLLSLSLLCVDSAVLEDTLQETKSVSGSDCVLHCTAAHKPGVRYRAVRWYKVTESPSSGITGLVTRDLPDGVTRFYADVDREVELQAESHGLFLPNVTCGDGGIYLCHLTSPVGEQDTEGRVHLTLTDCSSDKHTTDRYSVIVATAVLILALVTFLISYSSLRNTIRDRTKTTTHKDVLVDSALKPLDKKDLMLIYTLGPKTATMKHVIV
ncbi:uncharacterized protein LOC131471047 isoform X2 [Solea solea]|uniref:uncharacterized protein LOC131471047 isoform X2 n=1 Tax=Solea solea TaxID=90069 RepID=UPI00272BE817|nr:uncharacterized protein LOC131471047 isoform X2 [Solea solea]